MSGNKPEGKQDSSKNAKKPWENGKKQWPSGQSWDGNKCVPTLWFGGNNFHVFREDLSMECLTKYGSLGMLIEKGTYYELDQPKRSEFTLSEEEGNNKLLYLEALKGWAKSTAELKNICKMLYGLIWGYLSPESMDEVKMYSDYKLFNELKCPEGLWGAIVVTHGINGVSKVPQVLKHVASKSYHDCRQGGYESLITYHEMFDAMLKSYDITENVTLQEEDVAMHFFSGLDHGKYSGMKTMMHNMMTLGAKDPLLSVNKVYQIATNWVKTLPVSKPGQSTMFVMVGLDKPTGKVRGGKKKGNHKNDLPW